MSWDEHAEGWDDDAAVRAYSSAAFDNLLGLHRQRRIDLDTARVLDFGCGTGLLTERMAPRARRVIALDTSAAMIRVISEKLERLGLDNVDAMPLSVVRARSGFPQAFEEPFNLITCSSVCAFLDDYPGTVADLVRHLRIGGCFVQWDWEFDPDAEEPFGLSRARIRKTLEGAGLIDVVVKTAFDVEFEGMRMCPLTGHGIR